jgi:hypothetical protein
MRTESETKSQLSFILSEAGAKEKEETLTRRLGTRLLLCDAMKKVACAVLPIVKKKKRGGRGSVWEVLNMCAACDD